MIHVDQENTTCDESVLCIVCGHYSRPDLTELHNHLRFWIITKTDQFSEFYVTKHVLPIHWNIFEMFTYSKWIEWENSILFLLLCWNMLQGIYLKLQTSNLTTFSNLYEYQRQENDNNHWSSQDDDFTESHWLSTAGAGLSWAWRDESYQSHSLTLLVSSRNWDLLTTTAHAPLSQTWALLSQLITVQNNKNISNISCLNDDHKMWLFSN